MKHTFTITRPAALRSILKATIVAVVGFLLVLIFSGIVPYNMDEFIHYDILAWLAYPLGHAQQDLAPYSLNFLNTGLILPIRAYDYSGSFPSLYYLPLWLLWRSPLSARFLGFLFMAVGGAVLGRIFKFPWLLVLLWLLSLFPYTFQHLVDTGPIGFHVLSVYLLYVLIDRWCRTLQASSLAAITLLVFLGIWTKFSYFWMFPGLGIFLVVHIVRHRTYLAQWSHLKRFLIQGIIAFFVLAVAVGSLLLSTVPDDPASKPYWDQLQYSSSYSLQEIAQGDIFSSPIFYALHHPLEATQRVFEVSSEPIMSDLYSLVLYLFVPIAAGVLLLCTRGKALKSFGLPLALYLSFLVTVLMIARTKDAWVWHHAVLSYPFLILAILATARVLLDEQRPLLKACSRALLLSGIYACVLVNSFFYCIFPSQKLVFFEDASIGALHKVMSDSAVSRRYVVHVLDWGMYFYQSLYGDPQQSVYFPWGMREPRDFRSVRRDAAAIGRKVLFVYTTQETASDIRALKATIPVVRCSAVDSSAAWQILAEPDPVLMKQCHAVEESIASKKRLPQGQLMLGASLAF